ncbi:MAG: winged helix-turn-helix domain-containing protein [Nitrososphaerales archaeon]
MNHNPDYVKRDRLDIILEMLEVSNVPVKKTHILFKTSINFYQLKKYLNLLQHLEMLQKVKEPYKGYIITEKGRQLLTLFNHNGFGFPDNHKKEISSVPL